MQLLYLLSFCFFFSFFFHVDRFHHKHPVHLRENSRGMCCPSSTPPLQMLLTSPYIQTLNIHPQTLGRNCLSPLIRDHIKKSSRIHLKCIMFCFRYYICCLRCLTLQAQSVLDVPARQKQPLGQVGPAKPVDIISSFLQERLDMLCATKE